MSGNGLEVTAKAQLGQTELDVSVRVEAGRCLALAGPSGAGKTSGLLRPHEGVGRCGDEVWLDTATGVSRAPDRRRVGYLFQNYALFPHLRGWQNVAYPLRGQKRKERRAHAFELLERFGVGHLADVRPGTYSGGESQRVALARALVNRPKVLLLDEPLGALDLKLRREMQIELKEIQREVGITFVFVTHDQEEALTMSDRIAVFNEGRIEQLASPVQLYEHPASAFVAGFVGTSNLLQGEVARQLVGSDGTFVIRPEKLSMTTPDAAPSAGDGTCVARGVVREVVYLGATTHSVVDADAGVTLTVSHQNADRTIDAALERRDRPVALVWQRDNLVSLGGSGAAPVASPEEETA